MKNYILILFLLFTVQIGFGQKTGNYHDFDFWIGEWSVYKYGTDTLVGNSKIESINDSTAIRETYHSTKNKYHGTSLNKFDKTKGKWEQFWVDNSGLTLHIKGGLKGEKMVMRGKTLSADKSVTHNRITWEKEGDYVRQTWETSTDKENWTVSFDGIYKPK